MSWKLVRDRGIRLPYRTAKLRRNSWGRRLSFVTIPHIQVTWYVHVIFQQIWLIFESNARFTQMFFCGVQFHMCKFQMAGNTTEVDTSLDTMGLVTEEISMRFKSKFQPNWEWEVWKEKSLPKPWGDPFTSSIRPITEGVDRFLFSFLLIFISETFHKLNTFSACALDERYRNHFMK